MNLAVTPPPPPVPAALAVRTATPDDAPAVAELLRGIGWFKAYAGTPPAQAAATVRALIAEALAGGRSLPLVALDARQHLAGYCAVHWLPLAILQGWEGYVSELFVDAQARGAGAGSLLLDAAVQAARARGCARIWLANNRERPSYTRGFYRQRGWAEQPEMARFVLQLAPALPAPAPSGPETP